MNNHDIDALETQEWVDALKSVVKYEGQERAGFLLNTLSEKAASLGISALPFTHTPYINTIPARAEPSIPGDVEIEKKINIV